MAFILKNEMLPPVNCDWSVLYSLSLHRRNKGGAMVENQDSLISLIEEMSMGNETGMSNFYDKTVNRVFGMAMKIVLRPELAEEVVGDVYLQVWRQIGNYNPDKSSPIGWLLMICRSRALDILRREKSATRNQYQENDERNDIEDESIQMPIDDILGNEVSKRVSDALQLLNKKQREAISLAFYRDMSHKEISEYTGQPLGTVKSNIRRAQDILRNILDRDELSSGGLYGKA